ncbi:MAG: hypothetical protein PHN80_14195 [Hespellia sp.]|nr:hypothetical protein [Hespellia sp.]
MYWILARTLLIMWTNLTIFMMFVDHTLTRKRNPLPLYGYLLAKALFFNIVLGIAVRQYYPSFYEQSKGLQFTYVFLTWFTAIFVFAFLKWTYQDSIQKIMILSFLADLFGTVFGHMGVFLINLMVGRKLTFGENTTLPLIWPDLLIPFISIGIFYIVIRLTSPWIERIKNHEVKHKKIITVLFVLFIISATQPLISFTYDNNQNGLPICIVFGMILLAVVCFTRQHQKDLQEEKKFLEFQAKLMEKYYEKAREQAKELEHNRQLIREQISDLMETEQIQDETIQRYLGELKKEYQQYRTGIYCDDALLDAVIVSASETMEKLHISFDCSLQNFQMGHVKREDLVYFLLYLLDFGIRVNQNVTENRRVFLHLSNVKNQLLITYETEAASGDRLNEKKLRSFLSAYSNVVQVTRKGSGIEAGILIES